jgi:hypothetical protein
MIVSRWTNEFACGDGWMVDMDNVLYTISSQVTFKYNRWVFQIYVYSILSLQSTLLLIVSRIKGWISEAMHRHGVKHIPMKKGEEGKSKEGFYPMGADLITPPGTCTGNYVIKLRSPSEYI